jgi:hypothetical protein
MPRSTAAWPVSTQPSQTAVMAGLWTALGAARRLVPETLYRVSFNRFHIAPEYDLRNFASRIGPGRALSNPDVRVSTLRKS